MAANSEIAKSEESLNNPVSRLKVEAQNLLGECYEITSSSDTELSEAAKWYLMASKSGHARATFNLANLYETGHGVEQDFKKALQLYQIAKSHGSSEAKLRIEELQKLELV